MDLRAAIAFMRLQNHLLELATQEAAPDLTTVTLLAQLRGAMLGGDGGEDD